MFNSRILINKNKLVLGSFKVKNYYFFKTQLKFFSKNSSDSKNPTTYNKKYPLRLYFGKPLTDKNLIRQRLLDYLNLFDRMSLVDYEHIMGKLAVFVSPEEFDLFPSDEKFSHIREQIRQHIANQQYENSLNPNRMYTPRELRSLNEHQVACIGRIHGFTDNFYSQLVKKFRSVNRFSGGVTIKPGTYKTKSSQQEIIQAVLETRDGNMSTAVFCQIVNKLVINITDADIQLIPKEYSRVRAQIMVAIQAVKFEASIDVTEYYSKAQLENLNISQLFSLVKAHNGMILSNHRATDRRFQILYLTARMKEIKAKQDQILAERLDDFERYRD